MFRLLSNTHPTPSVINLHTSIIAYQNPNPCKLYSLFKRQLIKAPTKSSTPSCQHTNQQQLAPCLLLVYIQKNFVKSNPNTCINQFNSKYDTTLRYQFLLKRAPSYRYRKKAQQIPLHNCNLFHILYIAKHCEIRVIWCQRSCHLRISNCDRFEINQFDCFQQVVYGCL